jgi:hypothetical protein
MSMKIALEFISTIGGSLFYLGDSGDENAPMLELRFLNEFNKLPDDEKKWIAWIALDAAARAVADAVARKDIGLCLTTERGNHEILRTDFGVDVFVCGCALADSGANEGADTNFAHKDGLPERDDLPRERDPRAV